MAALEVLRPAKAEAVMPQLRPVEAPVALIMAMEVLEAAVVEWPRSKDPRRI